MKTDLLTPSSTAYQQIAALLQEDEVVALPTETVYGLAANAFSETAVQKIFTAKERPTFDPLIVHVSEKYLGQAQGAMKSLIEDGILSKVGLGDAEIELIERIIKKYWPGPLTLILPKGPKIPDLVTAKHSTVGIRCPAHPLFQEILNLVPFPLAAPSANRFGRISPTQASDVLQELDSRIPAILDGGTCSVGLESTIIRVETNPLRLTLLRPGKVSADELTFVFRVPVQNSIGLVEQTQNAIAPGMLDEHYAPKKPLFLLNQSLSTLPSLLIPNLVPLDLQSKTALLSMGALPLTLDRNPFVSIKELSLNADTREMAQKLYHVLRELDSDPEVKAILADVPESGQPLSAAIRDRLKRASRNKPQV